MLSMNPIMITIAMNLRLNRTSLVWLLALAQALNFLAIRVLGNHIIPAHHAVIKIACIVALAWFFIRWKNAVMKRRRDNAIAGIGSLDIGKIDVLDKVLTLIIYGTTGLLLLEQTGSNMNTLLAFGGVSALAVGLASQHILGNFFGGIMIYLTKPFVVGDWIKLPEKDIEGYVEDIGWYNTRIRTFDKRPIYVPNSMLTEIMVMNPSRMTHREFKQMISIRTQDLPKLPSLIQDIETLLNDHPKIDKTIPPQVHFSAFGQTGVDVQISAYTKVIDKYTYYDIVQELLFGVASLVSKNKSEFASPMTLIEIPNGVSIRNDI